MAVVVNMLGLLSRGIPGLVVAGLALILMLLALVRKDASLMLLAALFALPSTYIFGAWAGLLLIVRLMPLFLLAAAWAISKDEIVFAWIFPFPVLIFLVYYLVNLVASNFTGV
ncbi:MAG: hypothetical protein HYU84_10645 [Chloroflexi bacterium]|nr:hypothetical protein [Chloroflexota bacterium]MBI3169470.1 hypothetical protein [Chloroflexota bacterium]